MKKSKHVFWESILIIASVLVFRSLWLLMDEVSFLSESLVLFILLIIGLFFAGISFYRMAHSN